MVWKALAGSALALTAGAVTSSVSKSQGRSEDAVAQRKKKSVVVIGAGLMGLGTALHLAERGHQVTIVEKASDVATVSFLLIHESGQKVMLEKVNYTLLQRASGSNGSYLCPTVSIGWASIKISFRVSHGGRSLPLRF